MLNASDLVEGQLRNLEVDQALLLPLKTHVDLIVTADDVLHSFALPSAGIKVDAVPGRLNHMGIFIERPGILYGQCSELCGTNHAFMPIKAIALSYDSYVYSNEKGFLFFCIISLFLIPNKNISILRNFSFLTSSFVFLTVLYLLLNFDISSSMLQWSVHFSWSSFLNIYYSGGVDGVSLLFLLLTAFLIPLCYLVSYVHFDRKLWIQTKKNSCLVSIFSFYYGRLFLDAGCYFFGSTDFHILYYSAFSYELQLVPLFPVHIWLPEAHVEAPTIGSVILAGVLLKMGTYGMLRFLAPLFSFGNFFFNPLVFILSFMSIYYVSLITFCQIDLKKLIAYSSVAHMGYVTLGLFTYSFTGLQGSIFLMLSHGVVSSLLFFLIGMLYDRYKTRLIFFYKSIYSYMPIFTLFLFFATLANVGFPGTVGFVGEFLLIKVAFIFASLGFLISITYSFWLYNRISFLLPFHIFVFSDLSKREFLITLPFVVMIFYFGLYP
ncbi:hypothetical protein Lal_00000713, partial [Lupinus albus]